SSPHPVTWENLTHIPGLPRPSISLSPTGVDLGGAVTVRCWGRHHNMRFLLCKLGDPNALQDVELAGDVAEFPIRCVSQRDAGNYSCQYSINSNQPIWSEPSDPVELVVAGSGPVRHPHSHPLEPGVTV
uniref:Immunoglobulin-like beta-sandwich domain-containing protein n=1 Tax=Chrysemys picta bellii TaxID=8478 RepID=A0A8C3HNL2_CHRPI